MLIFQNLLFYLVGAFIMFGKLLKYYQFFTFSNILPIQHKKIYKNLQKEKTSCLSEKPEELMSGLSV